MNYLIRYAPVDTFYLKMPAELADSGVQITGANIKEKPRIDKLPTDQLEKDEKPAEDNTAWAYYKIVLQSKVTGSYQCRVHTRRSFQAGHAGQATTVKVEPILAAGKLSDQSHFFGLQQGFTTFLQFSLGLIHILDQAPHTVTERFDLIAR